MRDVHVYIYSSAEALNDTRARQQTLVVAIWKRSKSLSSLSPTSFVRENTCSMNKINLIRYYYVSELFKPVFPFVRVGVREGYSKG